MVAGAGPGVCPIDVGGDSGAAGAGGESGFIDGPGLIGGVSSGGDETGVTSGGGVMTVGGGAVTVVGGVAMVVGGIAMEVGGMVGPWAMDDATRASAKARASMARVRAMPLYMQVYCERETES